ncbi:MAG: SRPBCC domain-containing protein [Longimicrobiales bacterium]|nr:SRPBCC domain-containing protein [Longimicrobiales bacterium]
MRRVSLALALCSAGLFGRAAAQDGMGALDTLDAGAFAFEHVVTLPAPPAAVYDMITGDISPWWDHNFAGDPAVFIIEPWPGGRFLEQFDEGSRDGVLHATVTFAKRPETLRLEGPLGLTGHAVHGVYTYRLEPVGDSTHLTLTTRLAGAVPDGAAAAVRRAWGHFLFDRLKPYVEAFEPGPRSEVTGHTLTVHSWPPVTVEVDPSFTYVGARSFQLYDVSSARVHAFVEAGPDSVVDRLYWFQVEEVLPSSHHHYDYSGLPRTLERAGLTFVADARYGPGYTLDSVDEAGDVARVLRLLADAGYRMPEQMMRLRMVTLDDVARRELLVMYVESLAGQGLSPAALRSPGAWAAAADALQDRALDGIEIDRP